MTKFRRRVIRAAIVFASLVWASTQVGLALGNEDEANWQELMVRAVQAQRSGNLSEAERLATEALAIAKGADPPDTRAARSQMLLGEIHRWGRKFDFAERSFLEAVASCERVVGPNAPQMVPPLDSLANFYYNRNAQYDRVLPIYKRLLRIVTSDPNVDERDVAQRARNLANVYRLLGKDGEAETNYKQAIARIERIGPDHADLPQFLLTLAEFYSEQDRCAEAEPLAKRAVAISENNSGSESLETAVSINGLAAVYLAWGKGDRAEELYARALSITEKVVGPESSDLGPHLLGLANAQCAQGKSDDAEANYQRAVRLVENGLGNDALELAPILKCYASLLREAGRVDGAAVLVARAESIERRQGQP